MLHIFPLESFATNAIVTRTMPPALHARNIQKRYDSVEALRGVDLSIDVGEFFGLLGPNGAGKTTFINALVGLVKPDAGEINVLGYDLRQRPLAAKQCIGLVPQEVNTHSVMPVEKVLEFQGGFFGLTHHDAKSRAEKLMHEFGLWEKRKAWRYHLSGGMQKRLIICRALMGDPKILILDEPTAGLDVELRHELWAYLEKLREQDVTIFLTTHYIEEAEQLCDRVAIINEGKIIACNTPQQLIADHGMNDGEKKNLPRYIRHDSLEAAFVHLTGRTL